MTAIKTTCCAALAALLLTSGCATHRIITATGLPADKYLVGGGFHIEWTATGEGTFIVAERNVKKLIITKRMIRNERYNFSVGHGGSDTQALERVLGTPLKDATLQAFWIPDVEKRDKK